MIDFQTVEPHQDAIHERLINWADWVSVRHGTAIHPMWRQAKSNAWQWHIPEYRKTCDILDAQAIEKEIAKLPAQQRDAVRWCYVYRTHPRAAMKRLGLSAEGLLKAIRDGRQMLINRIRENTYTHTQKTASITANLSVYA